MTRGSLEKVMFSYLWLAPFCVTQKRVVAKLENFHKMRYKLNPIDDNRDKL